MPFIKIIFNDGFNSTLVKHIYKKCESYPMIILNNVDISELNLYNKEELVVTIISLFNGNTNDPFILYHPVEINNSIIIKEMQIK